MEEVLCVCVGNLSRSPMMQAVLQQYLGDTITCRRIFLSPYFHGKGQKLVFKYSRVR